MVVSPLVYPGGKETIKEFILQDLPEHEIWVDVFGGGGTITLAKEPSKVEIYNDKGFVSLFFALLRHPEAGPELKRRIELSPMSEDEFAYCNQNWKYETDPIEQMRMWFVQVIQCFTREEDASGWLGVCKKGNMAKAYQSHIDVIDEVVERFKYIQILHRDCMKIIDMFDDESTLFYCDPPYLTYDGDEVSVGYMQNMTYLQHYNLLDKLNKCKAQVVLSGYPSKLYEEKLQDWEVRKLTRKCKIANNRQRDAGTVGERTECVWTKRTDYTINKKPVKPKQIKQAKAKVMVTNYGEQATLWSQTDFSELHS